MAPNKPFDTPSIRKAFETAKENANVIHVDYDKYIPFLEDSEIPDDQKIEFIELIWSILLNFVDLGFGIHPLQQVLDDNFIENSQLNPDTESRLSQKFTEELRDAASAQCESTAERKET